MILVVISLPLILIGTITIFTSEYSASYPLTENDISRLQAAHHYVERWRTEHQSLPSPIEFQTWLEHTPAELRFDAVGFSYSPNADATYHFAFWDGDAWVIWKSTSSSEKMAIATRPDYYVTGSKLSDAIIFLGGGILLLLTAGLCATSKPKNA